MVDLYICGASNPEVIPLVQAINQKYFFWDRIVLLDDDPKKHGQSILRIDIVGPLSYLNEVDSESTYLLTYVAQTMQLRWIVRERLETYGFPFAKLIHPKVEVNDVSIGVDTIIYEGALISPLVTLGDGCMVCPGSVIAHECHLGRCCFVSPGAVLNSRVDIGDGTFIGANATILPGKNIGAWSTIGAGAVVIEDVPAGATVFGNPARVILQSKIPPDKVKNWLPPTKS